MKSKAITITVVLGLLAGAVAHAADAPDLNGTWLFRGIKGQNCRITQTDGKLQVVTEKGAKGSGRFENDSTIAVDLPGAQVKGTIADNGDRIKWSNGESWTRAENTQPKPGWYVAATTVQGSKFSLALKLEQRGNILNVTGVMGNPANTKVQTPVSGRYSPREGKLSAKWSFTRPETKEKVELPVDGIYDPAEDAFDVDVFVSVPDREPVVGWTFRCVRSKRGSSQKE